MKCLVLGGSGFIGAPLSLALAERGYQVTAFDRMLAPTLENAVTGGTLRFMAGDFLDPAALQTALQGMDLVFHLVWTTLPQTSNADPAYDVGSNVVGTLNLLSAARDRGVRKVVFVSSGGTVYGVPKVLPIAEHHPTQPITSYGITKLCVEKYLQLFKHLHGLDYGILRLANPYGEGQRPTGTQGVIAAFLHSALMRKPVRIWGDGSVVRDYLHVKDAVSGIVAAATYNGDEKVFNLGSGEGLSLQQLVALIGQLTEEPLKIEWLPARPFDVPKVVLDISLARRHLGWSPGVSFEAGLAATLRWMKSTMSA